MGITHQKQWTDDELMALPDEGKHELVDGEVVHMSPAGWRHGNVVMRLAGRMEPFARQHRLGELFDGQTGFRLPNGGLRCPDISFVRAERLLKEPPKGFLYVVPDLVVEIVSPTDRAAYVSRKVAEYLSLGVRLLWVIDPETRSAVVYRPGQEPHRPSNDTLDGEDVLPGFRCSLSELLS